MEQRREAGERGGIDLTTVVRFVDAAVDALGSARAEIDALNVYPVPDGDTGTNMYLTLTAARDGLQTAFQQALGAADPAARRSDEGALSTADALHAFARGALLGARGNSGVILSELLGALARRLGDVGPDERIGQVVSDGLARATDACYAAVGDPVEGTMLTVLRAASEAADEAASSPRCHSGEVLAAAAAAAREALARTPEQLEALARAGVVDAGGAGLCVLLDAAEQVVSGKRSTGRSGSGGSGGSSGLVGMLSARPRADLGPDLTSAGSGEHEAQEVHEPPGADGPAYEVMYLLDAGDDAGGDRIPELRAALGGIGDSVVVVGDGGLWNVHVHTDDVGAAIEAGLDLGRPRRIRVTHFADEARGNHPHRAAHPVGGRRVVAVAAGPGLAALFAQAGAAVVEASTLRRASTGEILAAITGSGVAEVVVLPNDEHTVRAAEAAAATAEADADEAHPISVAVIPTRTQVQGLAALAVHDPDSTLERDVREMTATARHVRHGAVTVAARTAMTMAGPCEPGDVLGVVAGDFAVVGSDLEAVALDVLQRLLAAGGELVTVISGEDEGEDGLAARVVARVEAHHPHLDVVAYEGGQERYPLLLSVE